MEINAIKAKGGGGGGSDACRSVANALRNFHIFFMNTSLSNAVRSMKSEKLSPLSSCKMFLILLSLLSKEPVPLWRLSVRKTQVCWHLFMLANDKKASAGSNKDWKLRMGFLRKYVAISLVLLLLLLSTFLSLHCMTDLLAETRGINISTKRVLEELTVSQDSQVVYVKQVS